ncbi:SagB family peptide dehydrogenase [Piscinibacter koreensis]|uniref:SagB family peptide dehydrogenase n=1 Tax=Piscinibacter koreensis TaxID=2742824 RepID=A0A7Y6TW87_9BURK|nr:SagB family peptide dehydrogenase [Schlegelella koreensis]NUZ05825.1 SagB family peptide dehydrogenase [Schlegelella koreensis]
MSKLSWIVLPLLLAAAAFAVQALRGRAPRRHAVNVWSSVLLLAYLLATAGLGIFWVANQQLPVFDWHYLFGYATLALVALHLVFNFGVVWRHVVRRRLRPRRDATRRRRMLGWSASAAVTTPSSPAGSSEAPPAARRLGAAANTTHGAPAASPEDAPASAPAPSRANEIGSAPVAAPAGTEVRSGRRRWLVAGTALATGAVGFGLGMRIGRSGRSDALPAPGRSVLLGSPGREAAAATLAAVERFHAASSHARAGVLLRVPNVAWGDPPPPFKRDPARPTLALPSPRAVRARGLEIGAVGSVLWHTTGVTKRRGGLLLRASPSSGALHATELYVVARGVAGLADGLWHYDPERHALARLRDAAPSDEELGLPAEPSLPTASRNASTAAAASPPAGTPRLRVVATAMFRRTGHKYRDRTYRYVLADLGHALENLVVAAGALGLVARPLAAFDESRAAGALGIDEAEEGVLAVLTLEAPATGVGGSDPAGAAPTAWRAPALDLASAAPLGVTAAIHAATSLRAARAPEPRASGLRAGAAAPAPTLVLPGGAQRAGEVLARIAARRSVRRFAAAPLPLPALAGVLAALPGHGATLSHAVRIDVVVHAVDGLVPGAYRYDPAADALRPRRVPATLRDAARGAALHQDVIGEAAAVFVLSIDRAAFAADPLGPGRGYRHAFIEAGRVGERIYLEAAARGLGACAVGAFYDAEASALVGGSPEHEWVVHFAALGVPD